MVICTRPGCGVDFDVHDDAAKSSPCKHHPGAPVFHEGSKSWSCCRDRNKPVLEFDEFMLIQGCTTADGHTDVKQPKTSFTKPGAAAADSTAAEASSETKPTQSNGVQAKPTLTPMSQTRLAAIQQQNEQRAKRGESGGSGASTPAESATPQETVEEEDAEDVQSVAEGTKCKRTGCHATHDGASKKRNRSEESCRYHPGVAIFHEGSKGYACCKRRVLEFDEFLTIQGCTDAKSGHLFVGGVNAASVSSARKKAAPLSADSPVQDEEEAQCRIDHYETPADVRVTVYAKGVEMERSRIDVQDEQVVFSLALPALPASPNVLRRFNRTLLPFDAIDAQASSYNVTRFKVDLILVKRRRGESWPALERGDKALGYGLTFGRKLDA